MKYLFTTFTTMTSRLFAILAVGLLIGSSAFAADILVGSRLTDEVIRYDGTTGAYLSTFVSAGSGGLQDPVGVTLGPDGNLYVASLSSHEILRYNGTTGALIDTFVTSASGGLNQPADPYFGPDGNLYVSSVGTGHILRYDGDTGAFIDVFIDSGSGANTALYPIFGPDGNVYVSNFVTSEVRRYDGTTGAFIDNFVTANSGGLITPLGLVFGPDGNLYVGSFNGDSVFRYDGTSGAFLDTFIPPATGGMNGPDDLRFGRDGYLYVTNSIGNNVLRFDASSGAFVDAFVTAGSGGLSNSRGLAIVGDPNFAVSIVQPAVVIQTGAFVGVGNNGTGIRSEDNGATWTISNAGNQQMRGIAFGAGRFVIVGDSVSYSDDSGQTWTVASTPPSNNMGGVVFANGRFVAVGGNGNGAYSDDNGDTWTNTLHNNGNMFDVAFGNSTYVAVGLAGVASFSTDGVNWTASNHNNAQMSSVTFGNGVFVATAGGGGGPPNFIHSSYSNDNGQSWSTATFFGLGNTRDVAFGNGRFVTVGYGRARFSDDGGDTWQDGNTSQALNALAFGNNRFVAIGDNDSAISVDGISWIPTQAHNNPQQQDIAFGVTASTPPTADAGPDQSIRAGDTVSLDGSASFDDNTASTALDYSWAFFSTPGGSSATLIGVDTATPSFVADVGGTYVVELVVTDEESLASDPDHVEVSSDNLAPSSAAGNDHLVIIGTTVSLDGSASTDPEFDPLTYAWTIISAPVGSSSTIVGANNVASSFVPDLEGIYQVNLVVSDLIGSGAPDMVEIVAATAEDFSEVQIVSGGTVVDDLVPSQVTTGGNQNALLNSLSQAITAIQTGDLAKAIDKLEKALIRTDGCALRGSPDGNGPSRDWITDCAAQIEAYNLLNDALEALTP